MLTCMFNQEEGYHDYVIIETMPHKYIWEKKDNSLDLDKA